MLQPLDRIKRTFGLKVDTRFVSKLITTQYDDLIFSEDGKTVHPEMDDIMQLFGAMEQFSEDANRRMEKLDMPVMSGEAQKEMDEVLERITHMAKKSEAAEDSGGLRKAISNFKDRITERSKGDTRERFAAIFKACVNTTVALGEQVKAEKEYLEGFGELETAMSEGTILAAAIRKRQNQRAEDATGRLATASELLDATSPDSDDYAQVRHDAMMAQRQFDIENKRKLFSAELYTKMSNAHDFSTMLAMSLAQKTLTKENLWISMTNSLNTQQTTFSMAQANLSSMESLHEGAKMKSTLDRGNTQVIQSIGNMSAELQKRATMIAHSGGPGASELQLLGRSIIDTQRQIAPLREQLVHQSAKDADKIRQATLTFQKDMRSVVVEGAQRTLAHQKEKRDGLAITHEFAHTIDDAAVNTNDATPVETVIEAPRARHASP